MKNKGMVIFLVITLVLFIVVATTGPKPMDWSERYSQRTTSPFGGKLVFDRLPDLFPKGGVVAQNKRVMDFLKMSKWEGTNYMVVTKDFNPDGYEQEALLEYVAAGNNLFVAANGFSKAFSKELPEGPVMITGIALGTDSDNTKSIAKAVFGKISAN